MIINGVRALLLACVLLAGCGGPAGPATVEGVTDTTVLGLSPLDRHTSGVRDFAAPVTPQPTPEIMAARVLLPGETVRVMPVGVWRVMARTFPPHLVYWAGRTSWCESRWQPDAVGDDGHAIGIFQVWPEFWGEVPGDFGEQAAQAAAIVDEHGTGPWSTAEGCEGWRD